MLPDGDRCDCTTPRHLAMCDRCCTMKNIVIGKRLCDRCERVKDWYDSARNARGTE